MAEATETQNQPPKVLAGDQALAIAQADAAKAYRDLSCYRICLSLEEDGWHVDYELKDLKLKGGGPSLHHRSLYWRYCHQEVRAVKSSLTTGIQPIGKCYAFLVGLILVVRHDQESGHNG